MISSRSLSGIRLAVAFIALLLPDALSAQRPGEQLADLARHPDSALLVTDDISNFARALAILRQQHEIDTVSILTSEYFERATPGLRAYVARYGLAPQEIVAAMRRFPRYYASLIAFEADLSQMHERIRQSHAELKRLQANAIFPPTYFFVGNLGAGGLTRPEGLLVSAELFGATPTRDVGEFTSDLPRVQTIERLPYLVAHELMHYQQAIAQGWRRIAPFSASARAF